MGKGDGVNSVLNHEGMGFLQGTVRIKFPFQQAIHSHVQGEWGHGGMGQSPSPVQVEASGAGLEIIQLGAAEREDIRGSGSRIEQVFLRHWAPPHSLLMGVIQQK
jgi:hypothetical protein